jgi:DNA-binding NtrC family response regulator
MKQKKGNNILLVDDEPGFRQPIAESLKDLGYNVLEARDGETAMNIVRREGREILCVFMDHHMPGHDDGLTIIKRMREYVPEIPAVMVSGHEESMIQTAVDSIKLGAIDFFVKNESVSERIINWVLEHFPLADHELAKLKAKAKEILNAEGFITISESTNDLCYDAFLASQSNNNILILGESGTGKTYLAEIIYKLYCKNQETLPQCDMPYYHINCPALQEELIDSELFGHLKGSFTGAVKDKAGFFEVANRGVCFLDEIADIPSYVQVKLNQAIEADNRIFRRIGSVKEIPFKAKLIAATNKDISEAVKQKLIREDLLNRFEYTLKIPPLNERTEDIPLLAKHLLKKISEKVKKPCIEIEDEAVSLLKRQLWFGNTRQLYNLLKRCSSKAQNNRITSNLIITELKREYEMHCIMSSKSNFEKESIRIVNDVLEIMDDSDNPFNTLEEVIEFIREDIIKKTFHLNNGNISATSKQLGFNNSQALRYYLEKYGLIGHHNDNVIKLYNKETE